MTVSSDMQGKRRSLRSRRAGRMARRAERRRARHPQGKISDVLRDLAADDSRERIAIGDLLPAMEDRAFGALMLIFALPNLLPMPPGTSTVLGLPLVFLAAQLMLGQRPWLPGFIARRSLPRESFVSLVEKGHPWLARAERLLQPRLSLFVRPPLEHVIGFLCLVLALVLLLPIPLGNFLPAFAICMFAFALFERDGIWAIAAVITFVVSLVIAGGVVWAAAKGALLAAGYFFE